jgi:hypothetical protein
LRLIRLVHCVACTWEYGLEAARCPAAGQHPVA